MNREDATRGTKVLIKLNPNKPLYDKDLDGKTGFIESCEYEDGDYHVYVHIPETRDTPWFRLSELKKVK
jgi:hypothetical protein